MQPSQRTMVGVLALALGILGLGWIGIHKFMMGYSKEAIISIVISIVTCGIGAAIMSVISIVEGVIYLTKSDDQWYSEYIVNKKPWF